eukprot:TRINITY_DN7909_c0_g1_i1.p1 TRINITY_DN7909_c0_g1~~TRINITY_DN7909_c0_g1_i1.p1  ORF type:complete len:693 (+),score=119.35 TRINITY_DN7909_c0_g1_i1:122-2080(+)
MAPQGQASGAPPAKRARQQNEDAAQAQGTLVVPKDVVAKIKQSLAGPPTHPKIVAGSGQIQVLSWNIDGIDDTGEQDRMLRCLGVAQHIASTQPVAVLMQEVIPPQMELLLAPQVLGEYYDFVCPDNPRMPYYCAMLLLKKRAKIMKAPQTEHFEASKMGRHYLIVDIVVDEEANAPITLITTHLESTKSEKPERIRQLTKVLLAMQEFAAMDRTVILAGDLNARDDEVDTARRMARAKSTSSRVEAVLDAWVHCGSPKKHMFTWDTSTNNNLGVLYTSKCRFDRCLFLSPNAPRVGTDGGGGVMKWEPAKFELAGRSKVEGLGRFPSDHWAIETTWALTGRNGPNVRGGVVTLGKKRLVAASPVPAAPSTSQAKSTREKPVVVAGVLQNRGSHSSNDSTLLTTPVGSSSSASSAGASLSECAAANEGAGKVDSVIVGEEERRKRRETAAARAEQRKSDQSSRGVASGVALGKALRSATPPQLGEKTLQSHEVVPETRSVRFDDDSRSQKEEKVEESPQKEKDASEDDQSDDEVAALEKAIKLSIESAAEGKMSDEEREAAELARAIQLSLTEVSARAIDTGKGSQTAPNDSAIAVARTEPNSSTRGNGDRGSDVAARRFSRSFVAGATSTIGADTPSADVAAVPAAPIDLD